jgi:membrane protein YdbS with pleckstrin-like domain
VLKAEVDRLRHKYKINENGLVYEEGLLKKKRTIVILNDITKLNVKQGMLERLMHFGDVEVETYSTPVEIKSIKKPLVIAERIKKLRDSR